MQISKSYHQEIQQIAENHQIIAEFIPPAIPDGIGTPWLELDENHKFNIEEVWARDHWHLTSRLNRKLLAHTLCVCLNRHSLNLGYSWKTTVFEQKTEYHYQNNNCCADSNGTR